MLPYLSSTLPLSHPPANPPSEKASAVQKAQRKKLTVGESPLWSPTQKANSTPWGAHLNLTKSLENQG